MRTRRTLRGHLAKIYAMHWATDSRSVQRDKEGEEMEGACVQRRVGGWVCSLRGNPAALSVYTR